MLTQEAQKLKVVLGRVFNFKLGRFCLEFNGMTYTSNQSLELKTRPRGLYHKTYYGRNFRFPL